MAYRLKRGNHEQTSGSSRFHVLVTQGSGDGHPVGLLPPHQERSETAAQNMRRCLHPTATFDDLFWRAPPKAGVGAVPIGTICLEISIPTSPNALRFAYGADLSVPGFH